MGANAVAIGSGAGSCSLPVNTIVINGSGGVFNICSEVSCRTYVRPIRSSATVPGGFYPMYYSPTTGEIIVVT
jgi:hypothetical protein